MQNVGNLVRIFLSVTVFFVVVTYSAVKYEGSFKKLPIGSDEFGYLNLAQAISAGTVFSDHIPRVFKNSLLSHLKTLTTDELLYQQMLTPHAYHLIGDKVINRYPPGTSIMLSLLPKDLRQVFFPALSILLIVIPILISLFLVLRNYSQTFFITSVILLTFVELAPWNTEFQRVNSVAPTFGILIAAGILLAKFPLLSLALLSSSVVFRVANLILLPFFLGSFVFKDFSKIKALRVIKSFFVGTFVVLISGVGFYLLYLYFLLGSPFASSYPTADSEFAPIDKLLRGINFYTGVHRPLFLWQVGFLAFLGILSIKIKEARQWFYFSLILSIFNYAFFISHKVRVSYYPYASSLVTLGIFLYYSLSALPKKYFNFLLTVGSLIIVFRTYSKINYLELDQVRKELSRQVAVYHAAFNGIDVAWAEMRSGTIEYAADVPAFRFHWGDASLRRETIKWLWQNKYSQAFFIDDQRLKPEEVILDLKLLNLPYQEKYVKGLGRILEVKNSEDYSK